MYTYLPLNSAQVEIRLLSFANQINRSDVLSCRVRVTSLHDNDDLPEYSAISYTWGNAARTHYILVDGEQLRVPENTERTLRHLHSQATTFPHSLWIDAVSINQEDNEERSQQVALMTFIYSRANRVLAFLGPSAQSTAMALASIRKLVCHAEEIGRDTIGLHRLLMQRGQLQIPFPPEIRLDALKVFYDTSWFQRLWIVQEIGLGREVLCFIGAHVLPLMDIVIASLWMYRLKYWEQTIDSTPCGIIDNLEFAHYFYMLRRNPNCIEGQQSHRPHNGDCTIGTCRLGYPLAWLLVSYQGWLNTDPKDKIYGLLGLAEPHVRERVPIDYNMSLVKVLASATAIAMDSGAQQARILHWARSLGMEDNAWYESHAWPTWLPPWHMPWDWWKHASMYPLKVYNVSSGIAQEDLCFNLHASATMHVRGVLADTVSWVSPPFIQETQSDSRARLASTAKYVSITDNGMNAGDLTMLWDQAKKAHNIPNDHTTAQAMALTLTTGLNMNRVQWRPGDIEEAHFYSMLDKTIRSDPNIALFLLQSEIGTIRNRWTQGIEANATSYIDMMGHYASYQRFMITKTGRMGLAPHGTVVGDSICILFGNDVPYVLRQAEREHWSLMGTSYLHGIMMGEYIHELQSSETLSKESRMFVIC